MESISTYTFLGRRTEPKSNHDQVCEKASSTSFSTKSKKRKEVGGENEKRKKEKDERKRKKKEREKEKGKKEKRKEREKNERKKEREREKEKKEIEKKRKKEREIESGTNSRLDYQSKFESINNLYSTFQLDLAACATILYSWRFLAFSSSDRRTNRKSHDCQN